MGLPGEMGWMLNARSLPAFLASGAIKVTTFAVMKTIWNHCKSLWIKVSVNTLNREIH